MHIFCGSATLGQVLQENSADFLDEMNSKVIAQTLHSLDLIPEEVQLVIDQPTKTKKAANNELFQHIKGNVSDVKTVRKIFDEAAKKQGYGRMNTFAKAMLKELATVK